MKINIIMSLFLVSILGLSCKQRGTEQQINPEFLTGGSVITRGTRFIDSYGRQVIFSGVNKVNKDPLKNYTDNDSARTYTNFRQWGFNCVRLGVIWAGVEPEPGKYDEKYLDKIEEQVKWATENSVYVLLDMHQDLYGVSYGDGAPLWATFTNDQPHMKGEVWSDSYIISPSVQKAFDNFWANVPAKDGIGLQDHYSRMWQHVVKRFAGNKAVIGYDIMNEPFNGTPGTFILPLILKEYAKMYAEETGKILTDKEVMEIWSDGEHRFEALTRLEDPEKYSRVFDVASDVNRQFERTALQSMYQRVSDAIRKSDSTHILFLEHAYFGNTGILSGIEPVKGKDGKTDPLVAYAAHGYDLLVDTRKYGSQSNLRVGRIFSRINETALRIRVPVIIGEWGAFSGNSEALSASAGFITNLFAGLNFSNTYWCYYPGIEKDLYFNTAIVRPYPQFTAGRLKNYSFNHETGVFSCSWEESPRIKAPTIIYVPHLENMEKAGISLIPKNSKTMIQSLPDCKSGYLIIPVTGDSLVRTLEFKQNQKP